MFLSLLSFIGLHREKNTSCAVSVFLDLKGKATFEAHFHVFLTASYTYLWYPLVMNYNYLNQSFFLLSYSFYAQNDLWYYIPPKTPCLKLAVLAYFLLSRLPIQQFHHIVFQKVHVFYIIMYLKEVCLKLIGSAMYKDGSHATNCHIGIISRLISLPWGHCVVSFFISIFWKYGRATIKSRQVVLKVAFPFNIQPQSMYIDV